jgi:hypothetical protein
VGVTPGEAGRERNGLRTIAEARVDVKDLHYEFSCLKCPTVVTGTLPEVERHGWIDVSSLTHPNQWLCPSCSRGLKVAPVEKPPQGS